MRLSGDLAELVYKRFKKMKLIRPPIITCIQTNST